MTTDTDVSESKRRVGSGTVVVVILAVLAVAMVVGYAVSPHPRCALNVADRPEYESATVEGETRWRSWPPGFLTVCKAFDAEGNEIPYVSAEEAEDEDEADPQGAGTR